LRKTAMVSGLRFRTLADRRKGKPPPKPSNQPKNADFRQEAARRDQALTQ
jgi:hypothetical protein